MSTATEIIEHPILFKGVSIPPLLDGRKTQTRRMINPQPVKARIGSMPWSWQRNKNSSILAHTEELLASRLPRWCPYKVGDHFWVREKMECVREMSTGGKYFDAYYCADDAYLIDVVCRDATEASDQDEWLMNYGNWWNKGLPEKTIPSIHMPRWASRITLEITEIRVQRVQDISEEDAIAEGVTPDLIEQLLDPLARRADVRPYHWVHNGNEAMGYCDRCIGKAVRQARKRYPKERHNIEIDGGWSTQVEDGVPCCETCAKLLDYALTEWGVKTELDHFESYPLGKIGPRKAYELSRIFEDVSENDLAETLSRIRRLGMRILWDSINAKRGHPWENNDWVWVYTFKRIEK